MWWLLRNRLGWLLVVALAVWASESPARLALVAVVCTLLLGWAVLHRLRGGPVVLTGSPQEGANRMRELAEDAEKEHATRDSP